MKPRNISRLAACLVALGLSLGLALGSQLNDVRAQGTNRAAIFVSYGDHSETYCATFTEYEISGVELLRRAGLDVIGKPYPGIGEAVCRIQGVGCSFPAEECWCQCMGSPCLFWSYWYWQGADWVYSGMGASSRLVRDGAIEAWVWGDGQTKPPAITLDSVCGPAEPTAEPTATATSTHTQTLTPEPSATQEPTLTHTPAPPTPTDLPSDPSPDDPPEEPVPTTPPDAYPGDAPTEEPTYTLLPTVTASASPGPSPSRTRTGTPGPSPTRTPFRAPLPLETAAPTHTPLSSLQQLVLPAVPGEQATAHPEPGPALAESVAASAAQELEPPSDDLGAVAVAALISTSVAQTRSTPPASAQVEPAHRSYGAFVALAAGLLALVGYAIVLQGQRRRDHEDSHSRAKENTP